MPAATGKPIKTWAAIGQANQNMPFNDLIALSTRNQSIRARHI